ncbi:hypothetical protein MES5069_680005 [Mesorhizobium escarrei]|uniref:Uncharacterized protein n=1 Tax=Mesorhizobium escarrei TaxID=666018 RepID=A0ABM9EG05_9HYPH|nr:hypothetical protein MES5069_680005 [Mesorhizobium escarrei]
MFRTSLACLAPQGCLIEISATGSAEVKFNLAGFYHNESRIFGVDTLKLDLIAAGNTRQRPTNPWRMGRPDGSCCGRKDEPPCSRQHFPLGRPSG